MDGLREQGEVTLDPIARHEIYAQVQKIAAADLPYVSLWWMDNVVVMNRRVKGFMPFPNGSLRSLATVSITPEAGSARGGLGTSSAPPSRSFPARRAVRRVPSRSTLSLPAAPGAAGLGAPPGPPPYPGMA